MIWQQHIDSNPKILFGKPKIKNTRISEDLILEHLPNKYSIEDIKLAYPTISEQAFMLVCFLKIKTPNQIF